MPHHQGILSIDQQLICDCRQIIRCVRFYIQALIHGCGQGCALGAFVIRTEYRYQWHRIQQNAKTFRPLNPTFCERRVIGIRLLFGMTDQVNGEYIVAVLGRCIAWNRCDQENRRCTSQEKARSGVNHLFCHSSYFRCAQGKEVSWFDARVKITSMQFTNIQAKAKA